MKQPARVVLALLLIVLSATNAWPQEKVDLEMVTRIRYEGFRNSKMMDLASGLMDAIGSRLTGSPNMKKANEWTRDQLAAMGLSNAHLEAWGPFGRGWENEYVNVRMLAPDVAPIIAYAKAWTPGTDGAIKAKCTPRFSPRRVCTDWVCRSRSRRTSRHRRGSPQQVRGPSPSRFGPSSRCRRRAPASSAPG